MIRSVILLFLLLLIIPLSGCVTRSIKKGDENHVVESSSPQKPILQENADEKAISMIPDSLPDEKPTGETPPTEIHPPEEEIIADEERITLYKYFLEGILLEKNGKYDDAGIAFAKALEITPESPFLGALTSTALLQAKRVDEAIQVAEHTIHSATNDMDNRQALAQAYMAAQQWDKALEQYEILLDFDPSSLSVLDGLAQLYYKAGRYDDAIRIYRRIAELHPEQAYLFRLIVADILLLKLNRLDEAKQEFLSIAEIIPNSPKVHLSIGRIDELLGKTEDAIHSYLTALNHVRTVQDEVMIRGQLGKLYHERGSYTEAQHQYNRIMEIEPENLRIKQQLISLYVDQNLYENALAEVEALAKNAPGDFQIQLLRKELLEQLDRGEEAWNGLLASFQYAFEHHMQNDVMLFLWKLSLDDAYFDSLASYHRLDQLNQLLQKASEVMSNVPRILFAHAKLALYTESGNLRERLFNILEMMQKAEMSGNENVIEASAIELRLWFLVRHAFQQQGLSRELTELLQKCQSIFPHNLDVIRTLGLVCGDIGDWQAAESHFREVLEQLDENTPAYKDLLFQLAFVYDKMNRIADIERVMREAMERFPNDPEAYNFLGYTYADRNIHLEEALVLIEKALKTNPNDGNYIDSLGWTYFRLGKNQEAISHLKRALEHMRDHPVILDHLGDAYEVNGDVDKAILYWKKVLEVGPKYPSEFTTEFQLRVNQKIHSAETLLKP
ncbi:MAG: hypothetical protein C4527_11270 [Candidatus Omnitrophota bacterium]|jgi:tetratricopeptide (TPR) repeat protein|nr:MAG: hypothetical protein C4527_11270 [Candidatus Omnitrophota bacterium]